MRNNEGIIYLVPVPIGNLQDITLRALEKLKSVPMIACEDTRKTAFLLSQYDVQPPKLTSFHKFNERSKESLLFEHLKSGNDLAIVSDAGSPMISDPAQLFVTKAIERGIQVVALPGATALVPAISISGFKSDQFQFLGFLPPKPKQRKLVIESLITYPYPSIIYESVHHLKDTLQELYSVLNDRDVAICRELTKLYEECIRGKLSALLEEYSIIEKGEFVIVVNSPNPIQHKFPSDEVDSYIQANCHTRSKDLAVLVGERFHVSRSVAYNYILSTRKQ